MRGAALKTAGSVVGGRRPGLVPAYVWGNRRRSWWDGRQFGVARDGLVATLFARSGCSASACACQTDGGPRSRIIRRAGGVCGGRSGCVRRKQPTLW